MNKKSKDILVIVAIPAVILSGGFAFLKLTDVGADPAASRSNFNAPSSSSAQSCKVGAPSEWRQYYAYSSLAAKVMPISFPYFSQKDPRFASTDYGHSDVAGRVDTTIGKGGCGVTAGAMVLRYLGICTDPNIIAKYSLSAGHRVDGSGTSATLFKALAKKYGFQYASTGLNGESRDENWEFVYKWAHWGYPIIASVHDHTFTNDSHYIVIIGIDRNGNLIIADPNSDKDTRRATFNEIKSWLNHAHVIYK